MQYPSALDAPDARPTLASLQLVHKPFVRRQQRIGQQARPLRVRRVLLFGDNIILIYNLFRKRWLFSPELSSFLCNALRYQSFILVVFLMKSNRLDVNQWRSYSLKPSSFHQLDILFFNVAHSLFYSQQMTAVFVTM